MSAVSPDGENVYVTSIVSDSITTFDRDSATGALTQKPGTAGCISDSGSATCVNGTGLDGALAVTVSPDGKNVYVASIGTSAVAVFDRDPTTGVLTQKIGNAACIAETGGTCADGNALSQADAVVVSPDGANVYVGAQSSGAVAIFDRNPTTGALTQKSGTAGCISNSGTSGTCATGHDLLQVLAVEVSPDGENVYVASFQSNAITIFDRDPDTGALTQKSGTEGCIASAATAGCAGGPGLSGASSVAVSSDGRSVYASALTAGAVAIFDRDSDTGVLTQKTGTSACVSVFGGACAAGPGLQGARWVTVSPDGANVYVAASQSDAVAVLDRNTSSGALIQPAVPAGCISEHGVNCQDGVALVRPISVVVSPDGRNVYAAAENQ